MKIKGRVAEQEEIAFLGMGAAGTTRENESLWGG